LGSQFAALVLQSLAAAYAVLFLYGVLEPGAALSVIARTGAIELVPLVSGRRLRTPS